MIYRVLLICFCFSTAWAQHVPVKEIRLDNGMKVLLVQRKGSPNISAGWVAKVGSVNEHPGVTGMNAGTSEAFTIYFISVPTNKLELWFWMESDRLSSPVFREFYSERDVVAEERRMRIESTPTGRYSQQYDAMFWQSSPYGWPVVGWPSDLDAITREDAMSYFGQYYAPNNLTAALVGDFDPAQVEAWSKKYFGRLHRGLHDPEPVRTGEEAQVGEQRLSAS